MILTGPEIVRLVERTRAARESGYPPVLPLLDIDPFDPATVGPNSYDVRLADKLLVYGPSDTDRAAGRPAGVPVLDTDTNNPTAEIPIPIEGIILWPGTLYLGSTVERTATAGLVPWLDGRSSIGRLGIQIHATAGRGDDGFGVGVSGGCAWTLEITVTHPVRVRPGLRIGQLTFFTMRGDRKPYRGRYSDQTGPVASRLWRDQK